MVMAGSVENVSAAVGEEAGQPHPASHYWDTQIPILEKEDGIKRIKRQGQTKLINTKTERKGQVAERLGMLG